MYLQPFHGGEQSCSIIGSEMGWQEDGVRCIAADAVTLSPTPPPFYKCKRVRYASTHYKVYDQRHNHDSPQNLHAPELFEAVLGYTLHSKSLW